MVGLAPIIYNTRTCIFHVCVCSVTSGDTTGNVRDGENLNGDIDYTDEITAITTHFDGFSSVLCGGIVCYEWAVRIDGIGQEEVFQSVY